MRARPLIGVTTSEVRKAETVRQTPEGEPPRHEMALGLTYLRAVEAAGGLPVVIPPLDLDAIEPLLDRLSGICLSGGPDLAPAGLRRRPRRAPRPDLAGPRPLRAGDRGAARTPGEIPLLAICRGTQALNVVRGGSLVQHLPALGGEVDHRQKNRRRRRLPPVADRPRQPPGDDDRRRRGRRQLVPPPGDRPPRRGPGGDRLGGRRHDRGGRGPEPRLPARRPVARRAAHRADPRRQHLFRSFVEAASGLGAPVEGFRPRERGTGIRGDAGLGRLGRRTRARLVHARGRGGGDAARPADLVARPPDRRAASAPAPRRPRATSRPRPTARRSRSRPG